ncbi:ATP-binding protein [Curtobacterium sp. MCBD17_003]|uniref:ATP-binding protein n=1 Tax=Curtobacterium sp. MCBD17_003 TaxID=2175667 RepID=UPI000DA82EB7|nr:ATP-binding protein [Curtobacterium sp. MCBD17_003]WIE53588.1 ATP-binding protein [Curtobacterium sp. MCBD17_003]
MVADAAPPVAADPSRSIRPAITATTLERAIAVMLAAAALGFGAVTVPPVLQQLPSLDPVWGLVVALVVCASIVFVGATAVVRRLARTAQIVVAVVFLVALVTWPLTVPGSLPQAQVPWLWWLCNVATIAAAIAFRTWQIAAVYNVLVPVAYVVVRMTPSGGAVSLPRAVLDGVYVMILGGAALVLIVVIRRAAAAVDAAQATAVQRYARAMREHAIELERVQVDAIVHDSVLTTLLSAARADTPEAKTLAATMARNAIAHLDAAAARGGPAVVPPVPFSAVRSRVVETVGALAAPVDVRSQDVDDRDLPASVAEALAAATLQAAVNSVQHAGDDAVRRWVTLIGIGAAGVRIEIGDDGAGFDPGTVPAERLGVRRSIIERVGVAGGEARLVSAPGRGTRVVLTWAPEAAPASVPVEAASSRGGR